MSHKAAQRRVSTIRGALPVLLGEDDAAGLRVCWVSVESDTIVVSFDDGRQTDQRLAAAAVVYGLSTGQLRLARLVVAGHDLADAARGLGISVNTARTHLQRMFDKTGVRSQRALVRVLLGAGAPVAWASRVTDHESHRNSGCRESPRVQDVWKMRSRRAGAYAREVRA